MCERGCDRESVRKRYSLREREKKSESDMEECVRESEMEECVREWKRKSVRERQCEMIKRRIPSYI